MITRNTLSQAILAGTLLIAVSSSASASLFDFNTGNLGVAGGKYNSVSMTVDGISVDVTAYTITNDGAGNISAFTPITGAGTGVYVSSSSNNLGVVSSVNETHNMDGGSSLSDPDEALVFVFSQTVTLDYINFDSFGSGDDFNLTVDHALVVADYNANAAASPGISNVLGQFDEYTFSGITGTEFMFWADGNSDSFRIDRMKVSAVPVPAAFWLFTSGLIGLIGYSRKQKSMR